MAQKILVLDRVTIVGMERHLVGVPATTPVVMAPQQNQLQKTPQVMKQDQTPVRRLLVQRLSRVDSNSEL
ncbi:hypothetical protein C464_02620 [Halorubrum coriense DSM 10284]|uniref:Uncharacterized protein n=1 Tax=Halorubrum coriense DSM 10284 TaxID=1227466 RepID=M0ETN3_9EURY|nr:hypothetical protein C464_02620 [Halorubrum coriense DSM 10284]